MKKKLKIHRILIALLTILVVCVGIRYYDILKKDEKSIRDNSVSKVILSLEDNYTKNEYWSANFNLLWNSLTDDLELDKISNTNSKSKKLIDNLNKKTFTKKNLSGDAYYNNHGYATEELKSKIEKDLKKKFDIKSNILDDFAWDGSEYFMYSMLYKNLKFKNKFQDLDNALFKNQENVQYFGIKKDASKKIREQVKVLYYQDINNFAVKLVTTSDDQIILSRGNKGQNFLELYQNIKKNEEEYEGSNDFSVVDELKVPVINFHNYEEIKDLYGVKLTLKTGEFEINKVIRDTTFQLDARGAKLKDEAGMGTFGISLDKNARLFYLTSDFNLFLVEKDADLPYFAMNVSDISKFQSDHK